MDLRNYIIDNNFKITMLKNKVNIVNYLEINIFDENRVVIKFKEGVVSIEGDNLIISKLLDNELLISGDVFKVEFR